MLLRVLCSRSMNYCRHIFYFITRFAFKSIMVLYTVHKWQFGMQHQTLSLSFSLIPFIQPYHIIPTTTLRASEHEREIFEGRMMIFLRAEKMTSPLLLLLGSIKAQFYKIYSNDFHIFTIYYFLSNLDWIFYKLLQMFTPKVKCNWPKSHLYTGARERERL